MPTAPTPHFQAVLLMDAALDCLRSSLVDKVWIDAVCINQDDVDERNAQVMRIKDNFSQSLVVTVWLGENEMSGTGLDSWVETSFDKLRLCNTIWRPTAGKHWKQLWGST